MQRPSVRHRNPPAWFARPRVITVAAATLLALGSLFLQPRLAGTATLSLVPVAVMMVVLLQDWRAGAGCAALIAAGMLLPGVDASWQTLVVALAAVICGEALRRGVRPLYVTLVQAVTWLVGHVPALPAGQSALDAALVGAAAVQGTASVALATVLLVLLPRRAGSRCRTGWDHIVFGMVAGTCSLALLATLVTRTTAADVVGTGVVAWRPAVIVGTALLASHALTLLLERMAALPAGHLLPGQLAGFLARSRRESRLARSAAARQQLQAGEALRQADMANRELAVVRGAVQSQSRQLDAQGKAVEQLRLRLQALGESARDLHLFANAAGVIEEVSGPSVSLLGQAAESLRGRKLGTLVPIEQMVGHPLEIGANHQAESPTRLQPCEVQQADGSRRAVTVRVHPFSIRGERHYAICVHEPDRMQNALATLEEAEDLKRSASQSRDQFIATMSHELRTPLHGLIATLDMLRGEEMSPDLQHHLAIARTSGRALLKIANDVLDLSRLGSNLFPLERKLFGLKALLREVVEEVEARAQSLGLTVAVDIVDTLPPSMWGDPGRLRQILGNLVTNALKFTGHGGVTLRIRYEDGFCTIDVEDTGDGIPADKRESIFEPFVQLGMSSAQKIGGTGLGLPISRRIAEAAGGSLILLKSSARGSTFRLTLPLEASQEEPPDEQSQRVFTNPHGRILVVEDNPANRYVAEALLASLDCPATIVESGREALALLREQEFDLILMDCQMPDMDGYETTRQARRLLKRRIPIIAMTANAMAEDRTECLAAGMDDFLPKPFGRQNLSEQLAKWLQPGSNRNPDLATPERSAGLVPDLDDKVLEELWESLRWQREPLQRICSSFAASVTAATAVLERQPLDRPAALRHMHTVLGSAGMVGARQVEYLAGRIQAALKAQQYGELRSGAEMLRRGMVRYERELSQKMDSRSELVRVAGDYSAG